MKDFKNLPALALTIIQRLGRYKVVLFLVLVAAVYGYLILQISSDSSQQPSSSALTQQTIAHTTPRIDPTVIQQLQDLQNNSVTVHALFNQGRSNPFQ